MNTQMLLPEDMMSQRFTLFYAGFTAHAPALYFNQLNFIDDCKSTDDEASQHYATKLLEALQDKYSESSTHIKTAISVANHMSIEILPEPNSFEDYFHWLAHYIQCFESQFPMARIDHYYFLFARKISEVLCNIGLLSTYVEFMNASGASLDLSKKTDKCLKDTEFILFKLMAAAALLSSEPRQNYFNTFYRTLCQEFQKFKNIKINEMSTAELKKLNDALKDYDLVVMDGFKKCVGILKELGI